MGLMFATVICYIRGFVTYNKVSHNSCNMGIHGLPYTYTLSPRACGPWVSGVYIRQNTRAHGILYNVTYAVGICLICPHSLWGAACP